MFRRLLILLAGLGLWWWMRRALRGRGEAPGRQAPRPRSNGETPLEGAMVRDRICDTFLPRGRALTATTDSGEYFFCSETCRRTFLEQNREVGAGSRTAS